MSAIRSGGRDPTRLAAVPDITTLIMEDHAWFRRQFAALDELQGGPSSDPLEMSAIWAPLAARLDVHALAEEKIFYPQLLEHGDNPEDETLDAIGDHNEIPGTASPPQSGTRSAAAGGGTASGPPAERTTSTWARRSTRASPTSASTPPPGCASPWAPSSRSFSTPTPPRPILR
jgi:hypothetical protein